MPFDVVSWRLWDQLMGRRFCRARSEARCCGSRLTQGLLRVALGYILPPPSGAESALAQVFRSSAFPANELPGYGLRCWEVVTVAAMSRAVPFLTAAQRPAAPIHKFKWHSPPEVLHGNPSVTRGISGKSSGKGSCEISCWSTSSAFFSCTAAWKPRLLKVCRTVMRTLRVLAPASDWEPKLTLRAITVGRRSRSARK